jgi:hypothetical protein
MNAGDAQVRKKTIEAIQRAVAHLFGLSVEELIEENARRTWPCRGRLPCIWPNSSHRPCHGPRYQQAPEEMVKAMRYPDAERGRKRTKGSSSASEHGFSRVRRSDARAVLRHSRSLAESVVKGITPLDAALLAERMETSTRC